MIKVSQIYSEICKILQWKPRTLIDEALKKFDDGVNPLVVKLPTGYGKTSITLCAGLASPKANWLRVIHVLPMRSIVSDIHKRLSEHLNRLELATVKVYKQHMGSPMSPFYCGRGIIATTLDTFMMNLFKVPATEFRKIMQLGYSHYDLPRANIYSSAVVFDEFHLLSDIGNLNDELKSLSSSIVAVTSLCEAGVPLVVSTATLPEVLISAIRKCLRKVGIEIGQENIVKWTDFKDRDWEESMRTKKILFRVIEEDKIIKLLQENPKKKTLIVLNKVERAVELFRKVRQSGLNRKTLLLHGRLREDIKSRQIDNIDYAQLVIATQIVEAGVDKSFDILISDACPLDRFIQRAGRVARFSEAEGSIYLVYPSTDESYSGVYSSELTKISANALEKLDGEVLEKLEFEQALTEEMESIYKQYVNLDSEISSSRIKVLLDLDRQPLLGGEDAKYALEKLAGFTNSFGIITVFDASKIVSEFSYEFSVGVSEDIARKLLTSGCMVLIHRQKESVSDSIREVKAFKDFKLAVLKDQLIQKLTQSKIPLCLSLVEHGIEGLAVEKIDPEEGLVWI
jgi:CRISPR-associated endonuclease/helicase Cas3